MTTKKFIECAIEGGWKHEVLGGITRIDTDSALVDGRFYIHTFDHESEMASFMTHEMLLDPLAWKAVGKVEGWREVGGEKYDNDHAPDAYYKHRELIEALWEGKTIEQYLETL